MRTKIHGRGYGSTAHRKPVKVVIGRSDSDGRELWHVTVDGRRQTLATSSTSVAAMDEALVVFGPALKRLANR